MFISSPIIKEPTLANMPALDGTVPNTSSATLRQFFPQMNMEWEVGAQLALLDGTPYTRRFSFLDFPPYGDDRLDFIPLQQYEEAYKGSAYFQLTSRFEETEYYSTASPTHRNFTRWERTVSYFNQEVIYSTEVLSTLTWERPFNGLEYDPTPNTGPPVLPDPNVPPPPPPPASCAVAFPTTPATETSTGTAPGFQSGTGGTPFNQTNICKQWQALPLPFSLNFYAGKAIAVSVTADAPFSLLRKTNQNDVTGDNVSGLVLMTKPFLQINFNATATSPTTVTITTYGKELWRSFTPVFIDNRPDILVHPDGTPLSNRLRPPGVEVNDSFWNNAPNLDPFQGFVSRQFQGAGAFV